MVVLMNEDNIIKITVLPERMNSLIEEDISGFMDKPLGLTVPPHRQELVFNVSYDGESEVLAEVIVKPDGFDEKDAEFYLKKFFGLREDEGD